MWWRNGNLVAERALGRRSAPHEATPPADLDLPKSQLRPSRAHITTLSSSRLLITMDLDGGDSPWGGMSRKTCSFEGASSLTCLDVPSSTSQTKAEDTEGNAFGKSSVSWLAMRLCC